MSRFLGTDQAIRSTQLLVKRNTFYRKNPNSPT
jgi:hypothetical protein